jgi:hypothetical protein
MKYNIVHTTRYVYHQPATLCHNQAHLTPREFDRQSCLSCKVEVSPWPNVQQPWVDVFGNGTTFFSIERPHRELSVVARSKVEVFGGSAAPEKSTLPWEQAVGRLVVPTDPGKIEPAVYAFDSPRIQRDDEVRLYAWESFPSRRPMFEAVLELTARIHADFQYDPSATSVTTSPASPFSITLSPLGRGQGEGLHRPRAPHPDPLPRGERE